MANTFTDQRLVSAQELSRLAAAIDGTYYFPSSAGGAVTANSGLTVSVAAIVAGTVVVNGSAVATAYAGGTVTHDAADATNPRRDYIYYNTSGAVGIKKGTPAAKPVLPDLASTEIAAAEIYIAANDTTISGSGEIIDKRQANGPRGTYIEYKSATQVFTTDTTFADITASSGNIAFSIAPNEIVRAKYILPVTFGGTGGVKLQLTGPASPTVVRVDATGEMTKQTYGGPTDGITYTAFQTALGNATAFSASFVAKNSGSGAGDLIQAGTIYVDALIVNGANAGTVTLQGAQNSSNSTTTFAIGCQMVVDRQLEAAA